MNKILQIIFLIFISCPLCLADLLKDDIVDEFINNVPAPRTYTNYNYYDCEKIPVKLKIVNEILSEKDVYEGQEVKFRVQKDVYDSKKMYIRKGTVVESKVKIVITSGMNGIPASIILGDFKIKGLDSGQLTESYEVHGQDRTLWVYPLKWALTILPPSGSLTNFIKGGHAKIKSDKVLTIYYYPNWI